MAVRLLTEACIETEMSEMSDKMSESSPPHGGVY